MIERSLGREPRRKKKLNMNKKRSSILSNNSKCFNNAFEELENVAGISNHTKHFSKSMRVKAEIEERKKLGGQWKLHAPKRPHTTTSTATKPNSRSAPDHSMRSRRPRTNEEKSEELDLRGEKDSEIQSAETVAVHRTAQAFNRADLLHESAKLRKTGRRPRQSKADIVASLVPEFPSDKHVKIQEFKDNNFPVKQESPEAQSSARQQACSPPVCETSEPRGDKSLQRRRLVKEWVDKFKQFTHRAQAIDRDLKSFLFRSKDRVLDQESISRSLRRQLCEESEQIEQDRETDSVLLNRQVNRVRSKLTALARDIEDSNRAELYQKPGSFILTAEDIEQRLEELENEQLKFTKRQLHVEARYESERELLESELSKFDDKLSFWQESQTVDFAVARFIKAAPGPVPEQTADDPNISEQKLSFEASQQFFRDIQLINHRLEKLGNTGNWSLLDHQAFVKHLRQVDLTDELLLTWLANYHRKQQHHSGEVEPDTHQANDRVEHIFNARFSNLVARIIGGRGCISHKSSQEIHSHVLWHASYLTLVEEKRSTVKKWREEKERKRRELCSAGTKSGTKEDQNVRNETDTSSLNEREMEKRKVKMFKAAAERAREKKKDDISLWKEEKSKREEQKKLQMTMDEAKRQAIDATRRMERLEKKQKLALHRLRQEEREQDERDQVFQMKELGELHSRRKTKRTLTALSDNAVSQAKARFESKERRRKEKEEETRLIRGESSKSLYKGREVESKLDIETTAVKNRRLITAEVFREKQQQHKESAHSSFLPSNGETVKRQTVLPPTTTAQRSNSRTEYGHRAIQPRAVPQWRKQL